MSDSSWKSPPAPPPPDHLVKHNRDRIVVLGRRGSGKTIFIARLYQHLWDSHSPQLRMRALDGDSHVDLMHTVDTMKQGLWPAATSGSTETKFMVQYKSLVMPLTVLDYPGESFRRAFVSQIKASDTRILINHIDRAFGVICLIDPASMLDGAVDSRADDEYGMVAALERLRKSPGGKKIPIALVLTKHDKNYRRLDRLGGSEKFARDNMRHMIRTAGRVCAWSASAVQTSKNAFDKDVPDLRAPPYGLVEPLTWCLDKVIENEAQLKQSYDRQRSLQDVLSSIQSESDEQMNVARRTIYVFAIVIVVLLITLAVMAIMR